MSYYVILLDITHSYVAMSTDHGLMYYESSCYANHIACMYCVIIESSRCMILIAYSI